ncbi:MAG: mechanosensitive ion channel [Deltaproteobacteria bacterium]|nr:mechanosensitive ion channel [Deltaproteobacteria bacterium]
MGRFLQAEYWTSLLLSVWEWLLREVFVVSSLLELVAVLGGLGLGWLVARPLKRRVLHFMERNRWGEQSLGRFLETLRRLLTQIVAIAILVFVLVAFRHFGVPGRILDTAVSLLSAWVLIRLLASIVREPSWARFIAAAAWTIAALHILSLLDPTLALLDSLAVQLGGVRVSLLLLMKAVLLLGLLLWLALGTSGLLEKRIRTLDGLTPSIQVFLAKALKATLLVTAVIATLSTLGINLSAFAFFGGAIGVGVGFGLQKVVSNLVSGLILLLDRSIKPGDIIEVGQTYGRIQSLGARYVSVITRDNTEYIIPNEDLITNRVINWSYTDRLVRLKITVGVSYESDVHEVMRLMTEAAGNIPRVLENPKPACHLKNFGDSSIDMELRIWIGDPENGISNVRSAVRIAIWDTFKKHHIEIPFPQRDLHIKSQRS